MLSDELKKRSVNLQLIKGFAAIGVIFAHSFALSNNTHDFLCYLTRGTLDFGSLGVAIFFLASGLLVSKSVRKGSAGEYWRKRCIRIFPPLIAVAILSIILGGFVTELAPSAYWTSASTWKYLLNGVLILQHDLPGVFLHNIYGRTVNGALWTMPVEFLCYILIFIIYKLRFLERKRYIWGFTAFVILAIGARYYLFAHNMSALASAIQPVYFFVVGGLLNVYSDIIPMKKWLLLISAAGFVVCHVLGVGVVANWLFLPYIIVYFSFMKPQYKGKIIPRLGDLSYVIYLVAFPIQQTLAFANGGAMNPYVNFAVASVISLLVGIILNVTVEKRFS